MTTAIILLLPILIIIGVRWLEEKSLNKLYDVADLPTEARVMKMSMKDKSNTSKLD